MMTIAQTKKTVNNTSDKTLLNDLDFAKTLLSTVLPDGLKNSQEQRSILADTIYYLIQCRLDKISNCNKLYTLGELYFYLQIPKGFLKSNA
jgi:hypothetical protein